MINEKNYMVSGKVTTTNLYCGGAAPTKEMLEQPVTERQRSVLRLGRQNRPLVVLRHWPLFPKHPPPEYVAPA